MRPLESLYLKTHPGVRAIGRAAWDHLVGDATPFLEYGFLSSLEETGCVGEDSGWYPAIVTAHAGDPAERGGGEESPALAAAPLYVKTHSRGEFVFDWGWADAAQRAGIAYYPKGVVAAPLSPVTGARLLVAPDAPEPEALKRALVQGVIQVAKQMDLSSVHFNFVLPEEVAIFEELGLGIRHGMQYQWYNGPLLGDGEIGDDYGDFDAWLARFRSKKRANIRRERRKLLEAGVTTEILVGDDVTEAHLDRMFDYYKDTVDKFYWGHQYLNRDFFHAIGPALRERLHMVVARDEGGREFAGTFNLHKGARLYGRYWGEADSEAYAHFEACFYRPIEWCIEHGVQVFEPGAGGEHKYERGFMPTRTYSAHWVANPGLDAAVRDFMRRERVAVDAEIEGLREDSPYK